MPEFYHKLFRAVDNDPKCTRLQEYSQKLKARNEISEGVYKRTRPKDARLARAPGLHKLQKKICPSSQAPPNQRCQKNVSV